MGTIKLLTLDVVGTLIHVRGSVGHYYNQVALRWGVNLDSETLDQNFYHAFQNEPPVSFQNVAPKDWEAAEQAWWSRVVWHTVQGEQFTDFEGFFAELWATFALGTTWQPYPETLAVLRALQQHPIRLHVVTNFDRRVVQVLQDLELDTFFEHIIYSTQVGSAKPAPKIFQAALAGQPPHTVLHVGDSWYEDYQGATQAGLQALWLNRGITDHRPYIHTLIELLSYL